MYQLGVVVAEKADVISGYVSPCIQSLKMGKFWFCCSLPWSEHTRILYSYKSTILFKGLWTHWTTI